MLESNKGFQMLKKMGWKEGQALGATESGMLEPVCKFIFILFCFCVYFIIQVSFKKKLEFLVYKLY